MLELPDLFIWERGWRLPEPFDSKREFKRFLSKNDYIMITDPHYSKKNGHHFDILQYGKNGKIKRKIHCKMDDHLGKSFAKYLSKLLDNKSERS